jgi:hypothetical protein
MRLNTTETLRYGILAILAVFGATHAIAQTPTAKNPHDRG